MPAALAEVKEEWRHFRDDKPGERFRNHRERMKHKSKKHAAVAIGLGVLLLVGGVVLLFMPGPGIPLIIFGVALIGSHSEKLSGALDRAEPRARERGHHAKRWWQELPRPRKGVLIAAAAAVATLGVVATSAAVSTYLL
jgi:hypothetical protein